MITRQHAVDRRRHLKQAPWRLRMAWHTARGEYRRLSGNYWRLLDESRRGEQPKLTAEDFRQLRTIYEAMQVRDGVRLDAHGVVELIRRASPELAAKLVAGMQHDSAQANRCWELNHEGQLDRYREEARQRALAEAATRG